MERTEDTGASVTECADALASRLTGRERSFADVKSACNSEYEALLQAVGRLDTRLAPDRPGRPGAVAAVRNALPAVEQELFDAIVDDHTCEVAAVEEALFQLIRAIGRTSSATT